MRTRLLNETLERLDIAANKIGGAGQTDRASGIEYAVKEIRRIDKLATDGRKQKQLQKQNSIMQNTGTLS